MTKEPHSQVDMLIDGGIVVSMDAQRRIFSPGYVAIRDGKIVEVGAGNGRRFTANERIDATGMAVLPGLVNPHDHLDQSVQRTCNNEQQDSRNRMLSFARGLTRERARAAANLSLLELVKHGVTTTQENHWMHYHPDSTDGICEAVQDSGMRAYISRGMNDESAYTPPEFLERAEDVLADLDRLEQAYDSEHITITSEPTTILRCKPDTILAMRDWALQRSKLWHIHLAQGQSELEDALRTVGMGSVQYAEKLGVLGPEMLAIHCSGLLEGEVSLLGAYGVHIAHCPMPIIRAGGKVPPIWELEQGGAQVAIGTDGSGTNNGQNPWECLKVAVYMQRVRYGDRYLGTAEQALEMATIKAARALAMDQRVGSLESGKEADLALFRLDQVHLAPDAMLIHNLVYSGGNNMADTVLVGGRVILRDGRSTVFDEAEVIARVREAQRAMYKESGWQGPLPLTTSWPVIAA
ncbi:MAG: amidohydrolase family protein [Chloroflexi bacterium]|nr:amidohydrolase family protein [Chloroflexota bacterium]